MLQYSNAIQANILSIYKVVSNCTIGKLSPGSVAVPTTVAFSGADSSSATSAQTALTTALKSGDTSVFGSDYGTVTVAASSVTAGTTPNPAGT